MHFIAAISNRCPANTSIWNWVWKMIISDIYWCANLNCICSGTSPTAKGSRVLSDFHFLCGDTVHANLPPNWEVFVLLSPFLIQDLGRTVILPRSWLNRDSKHLKRLWKRDNLFDRGVSYDQRIWGTGHRVAMALFSNFGISNVVREVEYMCFPFLWILNTPLNMQNATKTEISAFRVMVLQHRMVLDMSLAAQGGV